MSAKTETSELDLIHKQLDDARNFLSVVTWENSSTKALDMAVGRILDAVEILVARAERDENR